MRKAITTRFITFDNAVIAIQALQEMAFEEYFLLPGSEQLVLQWAERIGQVVAYDAVYLALSEQVAAEFWTGDQRLAQAAHQAGADWVHQV